MNDDGKTDGFKFALTVLTTIGALLYATYSYFQKTAIEIKYYNFFIGLISILLILFLLLIFYIVIKGYSLEIHHAEDHGLKERNEKWASSIYLQAFLILIMLLTSFLLLSVSSLIGISNNIISNIIIYILSALSSFFVGLPYLERKQYNLDYEKVSKRRKPYLRIQKILKILYDYIIHFFSRKTKQKLEKLYLIVKNTLGEKNQQKLKKFNLRFKNAKKRGLDINSQKFLAFEFVLNLLYKATFIWFIIYTLLLIFPLCSVTFDVQSIYYKNDEQIPIQIKVTGPIYDSQLKLYKETSENNLTLIDQLSLKPEHNSSRKISGTQSILSGNSFELGTYYSFINTTNPNITVGYYELIYSFSKYEYGKGFYLLNKSGISPIK